MRVVWLCFAAANLGVCGCWLWLDNYGGLSQKLVGGGMRIVWLCFAAANGGFKGGGLAFDVDDAAYGAEVEFFFYFGVGVDLEEDVFLGGG